MKKLPLYALAHARSGDKGDASNVGVRAYDEVAYEILLEKLTVDAVKEQWHRDIATHPQIHGWVLNPYRAGERYPQTVND